MTRERLLYEVDACAKALTEAEISLRLAIKSAYPLGCEVVVKIGGRNIIVRVDGYGTTSGPYDLRGTNVATDRHRRFHYSAILGLAED